MSETRPTRVLWWLGAATLGMSVLFGTQTLRAKADFEAYEARTIEARATPWQSQPEGLSVEACVDAVLDWTLACPANPSWCFGYIPRATRSCMESRARTQRCAGWGEQTHKTSFGFEACAARVSATEGKYRKRATKKACAAIYRAVADYCADHASLPP